MYQFEREEIELNEEEKEKAQFIIDVIAEKLLDKSRGISEWGKLEQAAFTNFQIMFYKGICSRLNLNISDIGGTMSITDDASKAVIISVKKKVS